MEVVSESLKVFIPCNLLQRGIEELPLSNYITHIHIFKSLKNTSVIGFGVNMVHGHKEDASFQKCRITLLQLIYRAGQGQSPRSCVTAQLLQAPNIQYYLSELKKEGEGQGEHGEE